MRRRSRVGQTQSLAEWRREKAVRTVPCPVCGEQPERHCDYGEESFATFAHTGRYEAAVEAGLVPAFAGGAP